MLCLILVAWYNGGMFLLWLACLPLAASSGYWLCGWRREALVVVMGTWAGFGVALIMPVDPTLSFLVYSGIVLSGTLINSHRWA
jgi:hypothetical protein